MRKGLKIEELTVGQGLAADPTTTVRIKLAMFLNKGDVIPMDSDEHVINLAERHAIAGLRYGVEGMQAGGRRRIRVGSQLAYGSQGIPGMIPENAVVICDVQMLEVIPNKKQRR